MYLPSPSFCKAGLLEQQRLHVPWLKHFRSFWGLSPYFHARPYSLLPGKQTLIRTEALAILQIIKFAVHTVSNLVCVIRILNILQNTFSFISITFPANTKICSGFKNQHDASSARSF